MRISYKCKRTCNYYGHPISVYFCKGMSYFRTDDLNDIQEVYFSKDEFDVVVSTRDILAACRDILSRRGVLYPDATNDEINSARYLLKFIKDEQLEMNN